MLASAAPDEGKVTSMCSKSVLPESEGEDCCPLRLTVVDQCFWTSIIEQLKLSEMGDSGQNEIAEEGVDETHEVLFLASVNSYFVKS